MKTLSKEELQSIFKWASENGHLEIVKLLLKDKRVDPSARNNYAIQGASKGRYTEIVSLLKGRGCRL